MPNPRYNGVVNAHKVDYTTVKVCPQCGSPDLSAEVVVNIVQDNEGHWQIVEMGESDLDYAMTNPNIHVKCTNPFCGKVQNADGQELPFMTNDEALAYFVNAKQIVLPELTEAALQATDPDLFEEYSEWIEGLQHVPWEGVVGECNTL